MTRGGAARTGERRAEDLAASFAFARPSLTLQKVSVSLHMGQSAYVSVSVPHCHAHAPMPTPMFMCMRMSGLMPVSSSDTSLAHTYLCMEVCL